MKSSNTGMRTEMPFIGPENRDQKAMTPLQEAEESILNTLDAIVEETKRRQEEDLPRREELKELRSKLTSRLNDIRDLRTDITT